MPRYTVQRDFPEGSQIPITNGGPDICRSVVERNAKEGVTWVHSYVSADNRTTFLRARVAIPPHVWKRRLNRVKRPASSDPHPQQTIQVARAEDR